MAATLIDTAFAVRAPPSGGHAHRNEYAIRRLPARVHASFRALCAAALCLLAACASSGDRAAVASEAPMPPLEVLMGDWHVAARVPWFGERGRVADRVHLAAGDGDRVEITRTWRDGFSEPLQTDTSTARRRGPGGRLWSLRAWAVLPARLRVLEVDPDGQWLLLDSPDRDHAWILTRAAEVADEAYLELERRIGRHGVNTDKLRRVPQLPEQEGRLGFERAAVPSPGR